MCIVRSDTIGVRQRTHDFENMAEISDLYL